VLDRIYSCTQVVRVRTDRGLARRLREGHRNSTGAGVRLDADCRQVRGL
jgi:hypothetical protein